VTTSRSRRLLLAISIVVTFVSYGATSRAEREGDVEVSVQFVRDSGAMEFAVKNRSNKLLTLPGGSVPWLCSKDVLIFVEPYAAGKLDRPLPYSGGGSECVGPPITIEPGGTAFGAIDLKSQVQGFDEALRLSGVVILWFWRARPSDRPDTIDSGGVVTVSGTGVGASNDADDRVAIEASRSDNRGSRDLQFGIANGRARNVSIEFKDLPWLTETNLVLRASALDPPAALDMVGSPRHERSGAWVTLPPGAFVVGEIPLFRKFPAAERVLVSRDVVVLWLYRGETVEGERLEPQGGFVVYRRDE
jgi:hypothetical protein